MTRLMPKLVPKAVMAACGTLGSLLLSLGCGSTHAHSTASISTSRVSNPQVVGLMIHSTAAKQAMSSQPSLVFKVIEKTSMIAPRGMVFLESPRWGLRVPAGSTITLMVSAGPPSNQ